MPFALHWSALAFGLLWFVCLVSIGRHLRRLAVDSGSQPNGAAKVMTCDR
jgi:hypothetical protein